MIRRRSIVGLSLLSVLAFCAFAAQGASAAWETATNTTAWTCVENGGSKDFKDADCSEATTAGSGKFGHVAIPNASKTSIESSSSSWRTDGARRATRAPPVAASGARTRPA